MINFKKINTNSNSNSNLQAEKLASKARNFISKYCYSDCKSFCCRKGLLILSEKEARLVAGKEMKNLMKENILTTTKDKKYLLNIGVNNVSCPRLKNFKCEIHKSVNRPRACKEFPIFIWKNKMIRISERCPALRDGLFYKYIAEFKSLGYDIK